MVHKIVRHKTTNAIIEAQGFYVPSKIELNHHYFPDASTRWMFKDFKSEQYYYLVDKFFHLDEVIGKHYDMYLSGISPHYQQNFKSTCVRLWLKGIILFMKQPVQYGNDVDVVLISLMNDLKVFLYRRMFCDDKYGDRDFTVVLRDSDNKLLPMRLIPFPKLKRLSSEVYDALYFDAKTIFPKYKINRSNQLKRDTII